MQRIYLIISAILITLAAQAQYRTEATAKTPKEVADYCQLLQEKGNLDQLGSMPLEQLKHIAGIAYEANATHPVALQREISAYKNWPVNPSVFRLNLNRAIINRISRLDFALVAVPYFLKASILEVKTQPYKLTGGPTGVNLSVPITNVMAIVQDVIKGGSRFSTGDTVSFNFFPIWRPTTSQFHVGETDFLPLQPVLNQGQLGLSLVTDLDTTHVEYNAAGISHGSYGRYPIVNDTVIDLGKTFGSVPSATWEDFRGYLLREVQSIKSW